MKFDTTRFGQVDVMAEDIIVFPEGPLGFPDCTRFIIMDEDKAAPFRMLQSLDNPSLAFVIIDPLVVKPNYHFNVTPEDLHLVKAETTDELMVYAIVTMSREIQDVTVNLQGPLVINPVKNIGHQYVLVDSEYTTREALLQSEETSSQTTSTEADLSKKAV